MMKSDDILGFSACASFGLWWVFFPRSVIVFYTWFHRGRTKIPNELGIRLAGALWEIVVLAVMAHFIIYGK
jgi:succinate-acetate transporter protein